MFCGGLFYARDLFFTHLVDVPGLSHSRLCGGSSFCQQSTGKICVYCWEAANPSLWSAFMFCFSSLDDHSECFYTTCNIHTHTYSHPHTLIHRLGKIWGTCSRILLHLQQRNLESTIQSFKALFFWSASILMQNVSVINCLKNETDT